MKSLMLIGLCTALSFLTYGCQSAAPPIADRTPTATQQKTNAELTAKAAEAGSKEVSPATGENNDRTELPTRTITPEIIEGRYGLGGTDEGLEVEGDRYRYYSEGPPREWRSVRELQAIKAGVLFDGNVYWCSSARKIGGVAVCSENGWVKPKTSSSVSNPIDASPIAEVQFFLNEELTELSRSGGDKAVMQREPKIIRINRHPCGMSAIAKVSQMPDSRTKGNLRPDRVIEVDAQNNTLNRWAKPVDSQVLGIAGDRILIRSSSDSPYWIDTSGNITKADLEQIEISLPKQMPYQKHPEFPPNGVSSEQFRDLESTHPRHIIADAPCT